MNSCYNLLVIVTYGDYVMKHKSLFLLALPLLFSSCTKVDVPAFSVVENEKDDTNSDQPLSDEIVKEAYDSKTENNEVELSDEDRIQEETAARISERQSQNKILRTNRIVNLVRTSDTTDENFYPSTFIKSSVSVSNCQIVAINDDAKNGFAIQTNGSIEAMYNKIGNGLIGKFEVSLKSDPTVKEELTLEAYTLAKIENFVEYKVDEENNIASIVSILDKDIYTLYLYQYYEKDGVSYPVTRIEDYAFANCTLLTNIWYLRKDGSFQGNNLPSNLEYIGKYAFYNCQLIASLKMETSSITPLAILDKTFYNCSSLSKFTISKNVLTSIGKYAFYNCKSLSTIDSNESEDAGASIEFVDDFAFANTAFTGSSPVSATKRIGYAAFMNCPLYADIVFNDSLEEIDDFAFANVSKIATIKIGSKLKTISSTSFFGINNYTVTIDSNNPYITCISDSATITSKDGKIMYSSVKSPSFSMNGTTFADKCIEVKPFAMYGRVCSYGSWSYSFSLVEIIGDYAFANTTNSSFPIQWNTSKLKSAGKGVFKNAKLTTVNLKSTSLTYISESMFENCKNLTSITLPANVTKIGKNAFKNCTSLTTINGLENVTEIEEGAFRGCSKLTAVNLNSIKHIGNFAFKGCSTAAIKFKTGVDTTKFDEFWNIDNLNYQEIA